MVPEPVAATTGGWAQRCWWSA